MTTVEDSPVFASVLRRIVNLIRSGEENPLAIGEDREPYKSNGADESE